MALVFSNNSWILVNPPRSPDPSWMKKDILFYSTVFAAANTLFDTKKAAILAEIAVNKRLYTELIYDSKLEEELQRCYGS